MTDLLESWHAQAAVNPARVVLADLGDPRADVAAARLTADGLVDVVAPVLDRADAGILATADAAVRQGLDPDDPVVAAAILVRAGMADAAVAGATRPSADVLRAGLNVLGVAPGVGVVSSSILFVLPDGRVIAYGD